MMRSKRALAAGIAVVTAGLTTSAAVSATTAPPATDAAAEGTAAEGSAAAEGGSGYVTLDDACAGYEGLQAPDDFTVSLVTDIGKVDDGTFNQFAYDGMQAAAECFGFETSFIETADQSDYASNIATSLEAGPSVLITVGFLLADDTAAAAAENPDIDFIGVDQFVEAGLPANMVSEVFAEDQSGYIAGVIAASLSETGIIGVVGGLETVPAVVKFVEGYEAGALSVNPDIQVLSVYADSFTDPSGGASIANQFIGEGADVIFGAGGQTGSGGVAAAAEQGVWGIGVDQDEYYTTFAGGTAAGSEYLASSAIKRVDLATFDLIAAAIQDEFPGGTYHAGDAANGQVAFAPAHDAAVPAEVTAAAEAALAGLADGSITTGVGDAAATEGTEAAAGSEAPATTTA